MKMDTIGDWPVNSEFDSRWNTSGRKCVRVDSGGPQEMKDWIEKCKELYGKTPEDLKVEFCGY